MRTRPAFGSLGLTLYVLALLALVLAVLEIASLLVAGSDHSPAPKIACGALFGLAVAFAVGGRRLRSRMDS
jgi:hypothetical protein